MEAMEVAGGMVVDIAEDMAGAMAMEEAMAAQAQQEDMEDTQMLEDMWL